VDTKKTKHYKSKVLAVAAVPAIGRIDERYGISK